MSITVTIPGAVETTVGATAPATLVLELGVPGPTGATGTAGATGAGVAAGGTTGQALVKVSATNYDTTWTTPVSSVAGRTGAVTLAVADVSGAAPIAAPTFTGVVTIPSGALISGYLTTTAGDAAYVPINGAGGTPTSITLTNASGTAASLTAGSVTTNANLTGVVTSTGNATAIADAALSIGKTSGLQAALDLKSPLASPTFTGTPLSTTPSININTTQIATTAFVRDMLSDCTWSVPPLTTCLSGTSGTGAVIIAASLDSVWTQGPNINTAGYAQKGMQMFARSNSTYGFNYTKEMRIACKMAIAWTNSFTAITCRRFRYHD